MRALVSNRRLSAQTRPRVARLFPSQKAKATLAEYSYCIVVTVPPPPPPLPPTSSLVSLVSSLKLVTQMMFPPRRLVANSLLIGTPSVAELRVMFSRRGPSCSKVCGNSLLSMKLPIVDAARVAANRLKPVRLEAATADVRRRAAI